MAMFDVNEFLKKAVESGASDIHLKVDQPPMIRRNGLILKSKLPPLTKEIMNDIITLITPYFFRSKIGSETDMDFSYHIKDVSRFRVNVSQSMYTPNIVFRKIPYEIEKLEDLGLPGTLRQFAEYNNGLVLVTGPTGTGKSTTLSSLIDYINGKYQKHIITIEDPVEFVFSDKLCKVSQRQVGIDTPTFASGIKYALRQDPDVIFVGEIRDLDTLDAALKAAETGHLVFATLHTNDAVQTLYRIINMYDPGVREQIRRQIAQTLRGTIAQKLVRTADGNSRRPALEVLVVTSTVKDLIIKNQIEDIYEYINKGGYDNMITMNSSLINLVDAGLITREIALEASDNRTEMEQYFRGVYRGTKNGDDD
ncbi:PilT/PilU family type 4a pilus ATPase [bacterium]|nr:PilT/PilU family type 4a pilus ATPase [bacterium]